MKKERGNDYVSSNYGISNRGGILRGNSSGSNKRSMTPVSYTLPSSQSNAYEREEEANLYGSKPLIKLERIRNETETHSFTLPEIENKNSIESRKGKEEGKYDFERRRIKTDSSEKGSGVLAKTAVDSFKKIPVSSETRRPQSVDRGLWRHPHDIGDNFSISKRKEINQIKDAGIRNMDGNLLHARTRSLMNKQNAYSYSNSIYANYNSPNENQLQNLAKELDRIQDQNNQPIQQDVSKPVPQTVNQIEKRDARRLLDIAFGHKPILMKSEFGQRFNEKNSYKKTVRAQIRNEGEKFDVMRSHIQKGVYDAPNETLGINTTYTQKYKEKRNKFELRINPSSENKPKSVNEILFDYAKIEKVYNYNLIDNTDNVNVDKRNLEGGNDDEGIVVMRNVEMQKEEEERLLKEINSRGIGLKEKEKAEKRLEICRLAITQANETLANLKKEGLLFPPYIQSHPDHQLRVEGELKQKPALRCMSDEKAREARNVLNLSIIETRAIKNITGCVSICDLVLKYRHLLLQDQINQYQQMLFQAVCNRNKAAALIHVLQNITEVQDEQQTQAQQIQIQNLEKNFFGQKYEQYCQLNLKISQDQKLKILQNLDELKVIYLFLPYFYEDIASDSIGAAHVRDLLYLNKEEAQNLNSFLMMKSLSDYIDLYRHNRKSYALHILSESDVNYLMKQNLIERNKILNFVRTILILSKESLLIHPKLFDIVRNTTTVQELDLNEIGELSIHALSAIQASIMDSYPILTTLHLEGVGLDKDKSIILKLLLSNQKKTIVHLNLRNNSLTDSGVDNVIEALKSNTKSTLKILRICGNQVTAQCGIRISHILKHRKNEALSLVNLKIITLSNNNIGNIGLESFSNFLKNNTVLKYLDVSYNNIQDRGLILFTEVFRSNTTLRVLNILGNQFKKDAVLAIIESMQNNKKSKLLILQIGEVVCSEQLFIQLINKGFNLCLNLKYVYIVSSHYGNEVVESTNNTFLPKVIRATDITDKMYYNDRLLKIFCRLIDTEFEYWKEQNKNESMESTRKTVGNESTRERNKSSTMNISSQNQNELGLSNASNFSSIRKGAPSVPLSAKLAEEGETIFEEILENKFDVNNIEIIVEIFEEIFAPDYQFRNQSTPFHSIAEYGLMEPLIYCFKLGVSPNLPTSIGYTPFPNCTALHIAAAREQYEICNKLIDLGVDINAKDLHGNTAAHHAALVGSLEISQLLHSAKANLSVRNKKAMIPMHSCIISDDVQTFQFLVERSEGSLQHSRTESVRNLKTYNGFTPIMVAIEKDSLNIFNYLIRTSANLNIQDDKGKTPLHLALQLKKENIAKLLIKAKALINIGDFNNETPVMYAVKNGLIDSLRLLHKTGANLFQINTRGETLLHMSARVDRADMIGYLIDKGLHVTVKNNDGQLPKDLAERKPVKDMLSSDLQQFDIYNHEEELPPLEYLNYLKETQETEENEKETEENKGMPKYINTPLERTTESFYNIANQAFQDKAIYGAVFNQLQMGQTLNPEHRKLYNDILLQKKSFHNPHTEQNSSYLKRNISSEQQHRGQNTNAGLLRKTEKKKPNEGMSKTIGNIGSMGRIGNTGLNDARNKVPFATYDAGEKFLNLGDKFNLSSAHEVYKRPRFVNLSPLNSSTNQSQLHTPSAPSAPSAPQPFSPFTLNTNKNYSTPVPPPITPQIQNNNTNTPFIRKYSYQNTQH